MVFKSLSKLFKKRKEETEYAEIEAIPEKVGIAVKVASIKGLADVGEIQRLLREGNIVFARIGELKKADMAQLKRAVDRIKRTCSAIGGDLVGVDEDYLIIAPSKAKIVR